MYYESAKKLVKNLKAESFKSAYLKKIKLLISNI